MLYVLISDETSKVKSIWLKVKVEIKGENVSLISSVWAQRPTGPLDLRPDRGRPTQYGWGAPVALRYIKRWGAGGTQYEVRRAAATPLTTLPI